MQLRSRHKEGAEVFTDSLNDIMFFLLLFFIIISTLVNPNVIKMELPSSKNPTLTETKVILQVDADHNYYVNNLPITYDQLEPVLLAETRAKGATSVNLQLDKSLTVQDLADILQVGTKLQLKMVLSTKYNYGK
jgi:biopolymer transport protein ExbD